MHVCIYMCVYICIYIHVYIDIYISLTCVVHFWQRLDLRHNAPDDMCTYNHIYIYAYHMHLTGKQTVGIHTQGE